MISVSSLGVYDGAYPAGSQQVSVPGPGTYYVRAQVDDPLGAYDITSLDLVVRDADGNPVAPSPVTLTDANVILPSPIDPSGLSKTYEYGFNFATPGVYTIEVTAHEGSEGITATATTPLNVGASPDLQITKTDGGATVNAGGTVTYALTYQNIGLGTDTNVVDHRDGAGQRHVQPRRQFARLGIPRRQHVHLHGSRHAGRRGQRRGLLCGQRQQPVAGRRRAADQYRHHRGGRAANRTTRTTRPRIRRPSTPLRICK